MIETSEIIRAVNVCAVNGIPNEHLHTVYIDLVPQDAARPCLLIESMTTERQPATKATVRVEENISLTGYLPTDEHGNCDQRELLRFQTRIMNLFRAGYLRVRDRTINVSATMGGRDFDRCCVDVQFVFFDSVSASEADRPQDTMGDIEVSFRYQS